MDVTIELCFLHKICAIDREYNESVYSVWIDRIQTNITKKSFYCLAGRCWLHLHLKSP